MDKYSLKFMPEEKAKRVEQVKYDEKAKRVEQVKFDEKAEPVKK